MYSYIKGTIEEISDNLLVIENNGIGYNIFMPITKIVEIGNIGDDVKVYTYTSVKEDSFSLFGFISKDELSLFKLLISVSGVGPKTGQEILGAFPVAVLVNAIINNDSKLISSAPGVGKKTADRIIIDLKDKVSKYSGNFEEITVKDDITVNDKELKNAILALISLEYSKKESRAAAEKAYKAGARTTDEILRGALKNL